MTDTVRRLKVTIGARALVPDISVTDPRALTTVPHDITAYTAIDALSHAIESYASLAASFLTDTHALTAMRDVCEHLLPALDRPGDLRPREGLARASLQAGLAFSNALLGATHAISHQLGGLTDLPHGLLNAILLPHVMEFNAAVAACRLADVAGAMGLRTGLMTPPKAADAAIQTVRVLVGQGWTAGHAPRVGVECSQLDRVRGCALRDAYIVTNPRPVGEVKSAPSARRPGRGPAVTDLDEERLEQLVGVHSSKTGYYAQWRGAERRAAELTKAQRAAAAGAGAPRPGPPGRAGERGAAPDRARPARQRRPVPSRHRHVPGMVSPAPGPELARLRAAGGEQGTRPRGPRPGPSAVEEGVRF